ncbi:MAG: S46 family peptidase, partial [Asticcacaulis sp.]|nr:S46 family peptidase [Asticcacaulis sp.]
MWPFESFPLAATNKTYGVKLDRAWLDHVRDNTVRLSEGCSASIVSTRGLVLTNQHCLMACAQQLSSAEHDYVADGFVAKAEEPRCEGLAAEVLLGVTDVTRQIRLATQGYDFVQAYGARATELELAGCGEDPHLHCQVVALYQGAQYKLYKFRKYSDLRLVFVPEFSVAFFGGDPDNFNFPRYALDVAFLRLYEDGQPVATPRHLIWSSRAPKAGEAVFMPGNPRKTDRYLTASQLETQRDVYLPMAQMMTAELRGRLIGFAAQGPEYARISKEPLFGVENSFKAVSGME